MLNAQTTRRLSPRRPHRAFTLIELLVVISVLGLLLAIGGSFATNLLERSDREATISRMQIVMQAIDAFYDEFGVYPPDATFSGDTPSLSGRRVLLRFLRGDLSTDQEFEYVFGAVPADSDQAEAWNRRIRRVTQPILAGLPEEAVVENMVGTVTTHELTDSYGNPVRYDQTGGAGGRPALISSGGDGTNYDSEDAIRSDEI